MILIWRNAPNPFEYRKLCSQFLMRIAKSCVDSIWIRKLVLASNSPEDKLILILIKIWYNTFKPNKLSCCVKLLPRNSFNFQLIEVCCCFPTDVQSFIKMCQINWAKCAIRHIDTSLKWNETIWKVTVLNYSEWIL